MSPRVPGIFISLNAARIALLSVEFAFLMAVVSASMAS